MHLAIPQAQRQRLLIFNLRTDADDHILGFTTRWINAIAPYYAHVDVLTTHKGRLALADNVTVYSTGRENDNTRLARTANFYRILSQLLTQYRYDACFAHMQPLFAVLGAPLLTARGVRTTTWYTHRERNQQVEWAVRLSYRIVSAVETSFPLATPKLRVIGHGIDTNVYRPIARPIKSIPLRIVQVARLTDIKHQHILLRAARDLDCEVVLIGDVPDGYDSDYKQGLQLLVNEMGMRDQVIFAGAQTPQEIRQWYQTAALAVNLSPPGLFDKAALEGMASGLPVIVSNPAFAPLTTTHADYLHIPAPNDVDALRARLQHLLGLSTAQRRHIGADLRQRVIDQHSLSALVIKLMHVMHSGELAPSTA